MANKKTVVVESNRLNRVLSDRHAFFDNFLKMPQALQTPDRNVKNFLLLLLVFSYLLCFKANAIFKA